jgi:hypothetical protein
MMRQEDPDYLLLHQAEVADESIVEVTGGPQSTLSLEPARSKSAVRERRRNHSQGCRWSCGGAQLRGCRAWGAA